MKAEHAEEPRDALGIVAEPEPRGRDGKEGCRRCDPKIARRGERGARSDAGALDESDGRLRNGLDGTACLLDEFVVRLGGMRIAAQGRKVRDVGAGGERRMAVTANDDAAQRGNLAQP